jgi:hypothetical protein
MMEELALGLVVFCVDAIVSMDGSGDGRAGQ